MRIIKKVLLVSASIFLVWQSYELLSHIHEIKSDAWWVSLLIAWVLNMFITGIFAFAGFALPTHLLLPEKYYVIRDPELLREVCKTLGLGRFKKFLLATFWRNKDQRSKYFDGTKKGIATLAEQSKKSEFGHLIPFILLSVASIYLLTLSLPLMACLTFVINILGNLYPVLLQRNHRMRIQKLQLSKK
jgi:hypothetical protein